MVIALAVINSCNIDLFHFPLHYSTSPARLGAHLPATAMLSPPINAISSPFHNGGFPRNMGSLHRHSYSKGKKANEETLRSVVSSPSSFHRRAKRKQVKVSKTWCVHNYQSKKYLIKFRMFFRSCFHAPNHLLLNAAVCLRLFIFKGPKNETRLNA